MEEVVVENLTHLTKLPDTAENIQGRRRSSTDVSTVTKRVWVASELQDRVMPATTGQSEANLTSNSEQTHSPNVSVSGAFVAVYVMFFGIDKCIDAVFCFTL